MQVEKQQFTSDQANFRPWFHSHQYLTKFPVLLGVYVGVVLFFAVVMIIIYALTHATPYVLPNCLNYQVYSVMVQAALAVVAMIFFTVSLWRVRDAFYIKYEMVAVLVGAPLLFVLFCIFFLLDMGIPTNLFLFLGLLYVTVVTTAIPVTFSYLHAAKKTDPEASPMMAGSSLVDSRRSSTQTGSPSSEDTFRGILADDEAVGPFLRFCIESWCVENLLFYLEVERFKRLADQEALLAEAQKILSQFLMRGGRLEINVDNSSKELAIKQVQDASVEPNLFNGLQEEVFRVMFHDTFTKWKRRKEYTQTVRLSQTSSQVSSQTTSAANSPASRPLFGRRSSPASPKSEPQSVAMREQPQETIN